MTSKVKVAVNINSLISFDTSSNYFFKWKRKGTEKKRKKNNKAEKHENPLRKRERMRKTGWEWKRSKDSCYWWLLGGQHALSVALTTRTRLLVFANSERSAAAFSDHFEHEQLHSSKSGCAALQHQWIDNCFI